MKTIFSLLLLCVAINAHGATYMLLSQTNTFANNITKNATNSAKSYVDPLLAAKAPLASPALTGTPTINGQSVETQLTNRVLKTGDTMTGNLSVPNVILPPTSITFATNLVFDFSLAGLRTVVMTTNTVITSSNLAAGASLAVKLTNSTASTLTVTVPTNWVVMGSAAPTQLLPGKVMIVGPTSWGTTDSEVTYAYTVQP